MHYNGTETQWRNDTQDDIENVMYLSLFNYLLKSHGKDIYPLENNISCGIYPIPIGYLSSPNLSFWSYVILNPQWVQT